MSELANRIAIERAQNERALKISTKRLRSPFRKVQHVAIAPVLDWISRHGIQNVPVEALLIRGTWKDTYIHAYKLVGLTQCKRQYNLQKKYDRGLEETKATSINFLTDEWTRLLRAYAVEYSELFGALLDQTTIDIIRNALGKEYVLQLDPTDNKTIRLLRKEILEAIDYRVNRISRTEATTISALGNELGARQWMREAGGTGYRIWFGRIVNERPEHLETNNTIIKMDDEYIVGGFSCHRPGDVTRPANLRINCRCSETFISDLGYNQYVKRGLIVDGKIVGV